MSVWAGGMGGESDGVGLESDMGACGDAGGSVGTRINGLIVKCGGYMRTLEGRKRRGREHVAASRMTGAVGFAQPHSEHVVSSNKQLQTTIHMVFERPQSHGQHLHTTKSV